MKADLLLLNGRLFTNTPRHATAMAILGDRIVAVGEDDEIRGLREPKTRVVDLGGRLVTPGFTDSHVHLHTLAARLSGVRLEGVRTLAEAVRRVGRAGAGDARGASGRPAAGSTRICGEASFPHARTSTPSLPSIPSRSSRTTCTRCGSTRWDWLGAGSRSAPSPGPTGSYAARRGGNRRESCRRGRCTWCAAPRPTRPAAPNSPTCGVRCATSLDSG